MNFATPAYHVMNRPAVATMAIRLVVVAHVSVAAIVISIAKPVMAAVTTVATFVSKLKMAKWCMLLLESTNGNKLEDLNLLT